MTDPLLRVEDLSVAFATREGPARAVDGLDLTVGAGETLAVVGESGSGKSVTAQAIMGLLKSPPAKVTGSVRFEDRELIGLPEKEFRRLRGPHLAMIFQDALAALNPVLTVGSQIAEMFRVHRGLSRKQAKAEAIEVMGRVGIPEPATRYGNYPHQFSGGMRQRAMIAMMIALRPQLLIADEPTTALDVTVQAQVMDLLAEIQQEEGMALLLITHDLGVVAEVADRVTVMYGGRVMEEGATNQVLERPANPYSRSLLHSVPRIDRDPSRLAVIPGRPPSPLAVPSGCPFRTRCPDSSDQCRHQPPGVTVGPGHVSYCWFSRQLAAESSREVADDPS